MSTSLLSICYKRILGVLSSAIFFYFYFTVVFTQHTFFHLSTFSSAFMHLIVAIHWHHILLVSACQGILFALHIKQLRPKEHLNAAAIRNSKWGDCKSHSEILRTSIYFESDVLNWRWFVRERTNICRRAHRWLENHSKFYLSKFFCFLFQVASIQVCL